MIDKGFEEFPPDQKLARLVRKFSVLEGRQPRAMVNRSQGSDADEKIKEVSVDLAGFGFDVDIGPMFQTPEEAAQMAVENDVHVVGVSSLAAGHRTLVPQLVAALKEQGGQDIKVVVGGVIPPSDYDALMDSGAKAVFGPGTVVTDSANKVLNLLNA